MLSALAPARRLSRFAPPSTEPHDVCIFVEGCYPYVVGGVSSWLDWLFRENPSLRFVVAPITTDATPREPRYELPANVVLAPPTPLSGVRRRPRRGRAATATRPPSHGCSTASRAARSASALCSTGAMAGAC